MIKTNKIKYNTMKKVVANENTKKKRKYTKRIKITSSEKKENNNINDIITNIQEEIQEEEKFFELKCKDPKKQKNINIKPEPKKNKNKKKNSVTLNTVKNLTKMYPNLKGEEDKIIAILSSTTNIDDEIKKQYILHKIVINDKIYYRDEDNNVINSDLNLVGIYSCPRPNVYEYLFF